MLNTDLRELNEFNTEKYVGIIIDIQILLCELMSGYVSLIFLRLSSLVRLWALK